MFSLLRRRCDLCFFNFSPSVNVRFVSTDLANRTPFAISYLINTCGLSQEKAISVLKGVHFESSEKPDSVIALFRDNGFSNSQISKLLTSYPCFLLSSVDKTLKPKFDFLKSQGISGTDLTEVIVNRPRVLTASLDKRIIPCFELVRSIAQTDVNLLVMLKRSPTFLMDDPQKNFLPNVALLRAHGVSANNIAKSLVSQPRVYTKLASRFREIVEEVKKMKFDPTQYQFLEAVRALAQMSKATLEAKLDVFKSWGLSEDEVKDMFRRNPHCFMMSGKTIMSAMSYFVNEMGYTPSLIAKHPNALLASLKRRIIPRCSVLQILKSKGLVDNVGSLVTFLQCSEEVFLEKYVIKFEKDVPALLATYLGKRR